MMNPLSLQTKTRFGLFPFAAFVGALALSACEPAHAIRCSLTTSCEATTRSEASTTRTNINNRIGQMQEAISRAVDQARNEIVQAIGKASTAITGSVSQNTASINDSAAALDRENNKRREDSKRANKKLNCGDTATARGPRGGGSTLSKHASGPRSGHKPSQVHPRWKKALEVAGQTGRSVTRVEDMIPPLSEEIQAANLGVGACNTWSDAKSWRGVMCGLMDQRNSEGNPYVDADIQAATLFDGPQKPGDTVKNISIPAEGKERDARVAALAMLNNPMPPSTPREAALSGPEGAVYLAERSEYEAAMSLGAYPSFEWDRLTSAMNKEESLDALSAIERTDRAFLESYFNGRGVPGGTLDAAKKNGISPMMLMDIEVERRIGNPEWHKRMGAATDVEKAAEQLMIDAYSLRLQRDLYMAQLQTNVLLGKLVQNTSEQRYKQKLDERIDSMEKTTN